MHNDYSLTPPKISIIITNALVWLNHETNCYTLTETKNMAIH